MSVENTDLIVFSEVESDIANSIHINELAQAKYCSAISALDHYVKSIQQHRAEKGNDEINLIDQGVKASYAVDDYTYSTTMGLLENCRRAKMPAHWSERQYSQSITHSGIMMDFDVLTTNPSIEFSDQCAIRMTNIIFQRLQQDLEFEQGMLKYHVFYIVKPQPVFKYTESGKNIYKYGFHILIPGIMVKKSYKKWLYNELSSIPPIQKMMQSLGAVGNLGACLDKNSSSVPVFFLGSCKNGSVPYTISSVFEVTVDNTCPDYISAPIIRLIDVASLQSYNLVFETSLTKQAIYNTGIQPLIIKKPINAKAEVEQQSLSWTNRTSNDEIDREEISSTDLELKMLVVHDPEARYLHALLDILPEEYYTEYNKWRNVIFAIANSNHKYKLLAVWFSQKCPSKWITGGRATLDKLWDYALSNTQETRLSHKSIVYWAKESNKEGFDRVTKKSFLTTLLNDIYKYDGELLENRVAKVLYLLLKQRFCTDIISTISAERYTWFEFVTPAADNLPGENWKWRQESIPENMLKYISDNFANIVSEIKADIGRQKNELETKATEANADSDKKPTKSKFGSDDEKIKYHKGVIKNLERSLRKLQTTAFKRNIITEAQAIFRVRGFAQNLNKIPHLFGTANGVLDLSLKPTLIRTYHEFPVSKFTNVNYVEFDPTNPMTKKALKAIEDIIIEPDARDWILFHAAQALHSGAKEGVILYWIGGGQNGKTSFLRWISEALGPYAEKFNIQLLTNDREDADKPNSAVMRFKDLNYAYCEESNKSERLNPARIKELVNPGKVSARDLSSKQSIFTMHANFVVASQYLFTVTCNDHALWRRQFMYSSKAKFRENPDPNNIYEKKDDPNFVQTLPEDPEFQSAILSILVHYYHRLQNEYDGKLKKVISPTIQQETEEYRRSQDVIHRWLSACIVITPPPAEDAVPNDTIYYMPDLCRLFCEWYIKNIDHRPPNASEVINDIKISALNTFLKPLDNGELALKGCRVLAGTGAMLPGEERLISHILRGRKTTQEWEAACARSADLKKKTNWWEAQERQI